MSRFLFVPLPLAGHVIPTWAVGQALAEGGHEVAWLGSEARLRPWLGPDATIFPTGMRLFRGRHDSGIAAVKSLWQGFLVPFARFLAPVLDKTAASYQPDVLVADQHAVAGALVATRHGLPWATLCTSPMELSRPFARLPKVEAWIRAQLAALAEWARLPTGDGTDLRFSPHGAIALTTTALTGELSLPHRIAMVGPALAARPSAASFPWDRLDPGKRKVLVTVGTLAEDIAHETTGFYTRAAAALASLGGQVQGIVVAPEEAIPHPGGNLVVAQRIPQLELMPHLDAVVCHGGMNTVAEALSFGVPVIAAPVSRDQPIVAGQVAAAGAGIRVKFRRVTPGQLAAAVGAVLTDPGYRAAALRVSESFAAAGGARAAAWHLEQLSRSPSLDGGQPQQEGVGT
jgi:zeaxanthin glucosyltransferase